MTPVKEKLRNILMNKFDAKLQYNGVWYSISCPFCGDSPNPRTRHCNIRLSPDDDVVIVHCFQLKCHASGIMNKEHLRQMGIYDRDITEFIVNKHSKSVKMLNQKIDNSIKFTLNFYVPENIETYFYNRTRLHLTPENITKFRVVCSIENFIRDNSDVLTSGVIKRLKELDNARDYIGFINEAGSLLELRSANKETPKDLRFIKVNLNMDNDMLRFAKHQPYLLERDNDYILCDKGYICVAEGKFDLINTFTHIMPDCNGIWSCTTAGGLKGLIRGLTKKYPYRNLVIVADKDVTDDKILQMIQHIRYRVSSVNVVRNKIGKDVGDLSEPMELERYEIK